MTCLRCKSPMYRVVGKDGAKATCSGCSQYVDCAQCSNPQCGDTKCVPCYNKNLAGPKKTSSPPIISQEDDF